MANNIIDEKITETLNNSELEIRMFLLNMSDLELNNIGLTRQVVKDEKIATIIRILYERYEHFRTIQKIVDSGQSEEQLSPEIKAAIIDEDSEKVYSLVKVMQMPSLANLITLTIISESIKDRDNVSIEEIIKLIDIELENLEKLNDEGTQR